MDDFIPRKIMCAAALELEDPENLNGAMNYAVSRRADGVTRANNLNGNRRKTIAAYKRMVTPRMDRLIDIWTKLEGHSFSSLSGRILAA